MRFNWDKTVYNSSQGTIFHTLSWLALIEKHQKLKLVHLGIFNGTNLVGVFPLFTKKFVFIKVSASPFVVEDTPYMGPAIANEYISQFWPALEVFCNDSGINFLRFISIDRLNANGSNTSFEFIDKSTHLLDISKSNEELWNGLEGRCRTAIRKAQKSGVKVKASNDRHFVDYYYFLVEHVYHGQNMVCPNKRSFYYDIWKRFRNRCLFVYAEYQGDIIAGAIVILDKNRAYYINGASLRQFRNLYASNIVLWESIQMAKALGLSLYDFVGSDIPRLAKFKKSFGGKIAKHTCVERASSKWVEICRSKYPELKQRLGRVKESIKRPTKAHLRTHCSSLPIGTRVGQASRMYAIEKLD